MSERDRAVIFVNIGGGLNALYDGTEEIVGDHGFLKVARNRIDCSERAAFKRQRDGRFWGPVGSGKVDEDRVDVVFVTNEKGLGHVVVGLYRDAMCEVQDEVKVWSVASTRRADLVPPDERPIVTWPGHMGMRRWARRVNSRGEVHSDLLLSYRSLVEQLVVAGPLIRKARRRSAGPTVETVQVTRPIRDSAVTRLVKRLHEHSCQVCGMALATDDGRSFAEGAHIRPIGGRHHGPDEIANVLCLCPNHHAMFDLGIFSISDSLRLIGMEGDLRTVPSHGLDPAHLRYHRRIHTR